MLGRATARLAVPPRGWVRRVWGVADVHTRQKWTALWPVLAALPERGIRLLDAGCGAGAWSLELAARRPGWTIVGLDRDRAALDEAERARARLGLPNVSFVGEDFLAFGGDGRHDIVLSVASAHYLAEEGKGDALFERFGEWLAPDGRLVLLGPRRVDDVWFAPRLARPEWHAVFTAEELAALCARRGLRVEMLAGSIGPLGTLAKQLYWEAARRSAWLTRLSYPVQWLLSAVDARVPHHDARGTLMLLLVARAPAARDTRPARRSPPPAPDAVLAS